MMDLHGRVCSRLLWNNSGTLRLVTKFWERLVHLRVSRCREKVSIKICHRFIRTKHLNENACYLVQPNRSEAIPNVSKSRSATASTTMILDVL